MSRPSQSDPPTPEELLEAALAEHSGEPRLLTTRFELVETWHDRAPSRPLAAAWLIDGRRVSALVTDRVTTFTELARQAGAPAERFDALARRCAVPTFRMDQPLPLVPVEVPKAWGREYWYTGIERRGVSEAGRAGISVPLPWVLALAPKRLAGGWREDPPLLKVLDPLPEPARGELYFEQHRTKREAYVVDSVDPAAWPDGRGGVRLGLAPALRHRHGDARLRQAFTALVARYERVRQQADGWRAQHPAAVPMHLRAREAAARRRVEAFTSVHRVAPGDAIRIPPGLPHALMHGTRVYEFQTPHFERDVVFHAQPVPGQQRWDTRAAMDRAQLIAKGCVLRASAGDAPRITWIASFPGFQVLRLRPRPAAPLRLPKDAAFGVLVGERGRVHVAEHTLGAGEVALLPRESLGRALTSDAPASCLIALAEHT